MRRPRMEAWHSRTSGTARCVGQGWHVGRQWAGGRGAGGTLGVWVRKRGHQVVAPRAAASRPCAVALRPSESLPLPPPAAAAPQVLCVAPGAPPGDNSARTDLATSEYLQVVLFDHVTRRRS